MNINLKRNKEVKRATMLAISEASNINEYTVDSSVTDTHPISMDHNRRLINELIDFTFDEQKGICEVSSSQCSSSKLQSSEYSYDKRLEYWRDILKQREQISFKIRDQIKKNHPDILYNHLVTVDERDKFTVKRLLDYAQRLNPTILSTRQPSTLPEKCDAEMSKLIPELQETLPQSERNRNAQVEISGLPKVVQQELLGSRWQGYKLPFSWLKSKHLENRIEKSRGDIERVIEYYPDVENLEIVGEGLLGAKLSEHNSKIEILPAMDICQISTDTLCEEDVCEVKASVEKVLVLHDYAFKINDQEFAITNRRCHRNFKTLTNFSCFPFQTEIKKIFTIQNIGRKVLNFEWVYSSFYDKNSTLLKCYDNEFIFDNIPIRLCSGETHETFVTFQPRRVCVVKSKWILKVKPTPFKHKMNAIAIFLSGLCAAPPEYKQKLEELQGEVIEKSNKKMIKKLTTTLSSFATDMQPIEYPCPYQRSLNEMELFEQLNFGFKCERYNDLQLLKELYSRSKKPRDKMWDLQVNTLKSIILNVPQAEGRALLFNELCGILGSMKGKSVDLEIQRDSSERNRCSLLYVRGIISTAIDEWVKLLSTLEETFYQTTLQVINEELLMKTTEELEINEGNKSLFFLPQDEDEKREYVLEKRVRKLKPYRDTLYMQTYTLLCDFMENIVNIIESTV